MKTYKEFMNEAVKNTSKIKHFIGKKLDIDVFKDILKTVERQGYTLTGTVQGGEYFYEKPNAGKIAYHKPLKNFKVNKKDGMYGVYLDVEGGMVCVHIKNGIITDIEYGGI